MHFLLLSRGLLDFLDVDALSFYGYLSLVNQRAGAVFPQRTERSAPVFTPPQTQPLSNYPPNVHNSEQRQESAGATSEADYPSLRFTFPPFVISLNDQCLFKMGDFLFSLQFMKI